MAEQNGVSNFDILQEIHQQGIGTARIEAILANGFSSIAEELRALRSSFAQGLLKTINVLCYCLVAIIMWVTAVKSIPQIFEMFGT